MNKRYAVAEGNSINFQGNLIVAGTELKSEILNIFGEEKIKHFVEKNILFEIIESVIVDAEFKKAETAETAEIAIEKFAPKNKNKKR